MEQPAEDSAPPGAQQNAPPPETEPTPSSAPLSSTSLLSDAPTTDPADPADLQAKQSTNSSNEQQLPTETPARTEDAEAQAPPQQESTINASSTNPPRWEAAREQVMKGMATSDQFSTQSPTAQTAPSKRGGRGGKRASLNDANPTPNKIEGQATPGSSGRGRGGGRPRGRGRGAGRGGKRKRDDRSDGDSSDSEVATPAVTMTKSGRNIQKPTSFVPPPPSPTTTTKRKRTYRRNPEAAVCKVCLRGTSPASNMIVFCDGCNTPYHRYCHQPPIDQAVIDEVDKEWYCNPCEKERIVPVPEADVASFVSAAGAPAEQRQKYFASLPPGMLVTLLTRATTLRPDLPLFAPDFEARASSASAQPPTNGHRPGPPNIAPPAAPFQRPYPPQQQRQAPSYADDTRYPVPDEHPTHYVRPGQGLMQNLPPEQNDMHYLVDDDRFQVFSHYHIDQPPHLHSNASMSYGSGQGMGMEPQARGGARCG